MMWEYAFTIKNEGKHPIIVMQTPGRGSPVLGDVPDEIIPVGESVTFRNDPKDRMKVSVGGAD